MLDVQMVPVKDFDIKHMNIKDFVEMNALIECEDEFNPLTEKQLFDKTQDWASTRYTN
jgi:hypothetical protein